MEQEKKQNPTEELENWVRKTPPRGITIVIDDQHPKTLEDCIRERQNRKEEK